MPKRSAGLLLWKRADSGLRLLLVHPGGPFWASRDAGAWSIPKGEYAAGEDPLTAAKREFGEELGPAAAALVRGVPDARFAPLGEVRQANGKIVTAFAFEGDLDPAAIVSNACSIEWPPRSGRRLSVPEIDRAAFFTPAEAGEKILAGQRDLLERLAPLLQSGPMQSG